MTDKFIHEENVEMPYSASINWLDDWILPDPPTLLDEYDLVDWMNQVMIEETKFFVSHAFKSARAKNDAIAILRTIYYEYFLYSRELAIRNLVPRPDYVSRLQALPQTAQKSAAWHNEVLELLTGHEYGGVVYGTPNSKNRVVAKKCGIPIVINEHEEEPADTGSSLTVFKCDADGKLSPFKWGWRFESVVASLFERCFAQGEVFDGLGRIRHPTLPRLAASPDGIIISGPRCGRLVEIKSPITREINGVIPEEYYCQMQLQAEVCNVDAVEFIEVNFVSTMLADAKYSDEMGEKIPWIGKICIVGMPAELVTVELEDGSVTEEKYDLNTFEYRYSPLMPATEAGFAECCAWTPDNIEAGKVLLEETIWHVRNYHTTTVIRNRRWWAEVGQPAYEQFWVDVEAARRDGTFAEKAMFIHDESFIEEAEVVEEEEDIDTGVEGDIDEADEE
jgi:YqaJ-like viral recombinase domain